MIVKKKQNHRLADKDLENKWKRALADYDNLRKRVEKQRGDLVKFAHAGLVDKLLPVLDSLEKCRQHIKDKGLDLTCEQLQKVLASEGLTEIKAQDEEFDPEKMDAVEMVRGKKNKVVEVVLKGYNLNGRVIRPAKVKVGQGN